MHHDDGDPGRLDWPGVAGRWAARALTTVRLVPLPDAVDEREFGGKAVQLGAAVRAGLPVPPGWAISARDAVTLTATLTVTGRSDDGDTRPPASVTAWCDLWRGIDDPGPFAVRSSAIGEDSGTASFAGAHLSVLGVRDVAAFEDAVRLVHASADAAGARAYRERLGLAADLEMAVVVQRLVEADVAGVMFTRHPVTGAEEIVVEATWGLGDAVASGIVTPDNYVLDASGRLVARRIGEKDVSVRYVGAGVEEVAVAAELIHRPCLDAPELAHLHRLAGLCDNAFGRVGHDVEFAFRAGEPYLLQRRPITHG